ncbi:ribosome maturation factor RimM [Spiroplasma ixodetis]|uniref:ribosome maturation factor RimM n=1 Tax=Spiroplasma ixodetis TaxID=2141 RepID=UPI0025773E8C|nr:ribosome maturation factor RimM [Spiroplasma ixodetis]WJG70292.1 16S rRNA processing protein RimM [Spiroplasma ixodetis Y32]
MKYLELGTIVNTHGLIGEVKVLCNYYGNKFSWKEKTTVYLEETKQLTPLIISRVRNHKQFLLLTFENYNTIELVEGMKNKNLVINTEEIINDNLPLFYEDILNYEAFDANNNAFLGKVIAFLDNNHQGLWEIKMTNKKTFFIPNNKVFINKINKEEQKVYFNIIEGLINND